MAELKLISEFKQLLEYDVFHGRKANSLTPQEKKRAANMINLIEEKVNRGHTQDNPIIKGRSCLNSEINFSSAILPYFFYARLGGQLVKYETRGVSF